MTTRDEQWEAHTHDEIEDGKLPHVHADDADWAVSFGLPMTMTRQDETDVIELMEFRGVTMSMRAALEHGRADTDLSVMSKAERQLTILAYQADRMLVDSLLNVVDQALVAEGVEPPCQLNAVESSNIRSWGYVMKALVTRPDGALHDEPPTDGVLYVAFTNGGLYRYDDVPVVLAKGMLDAESVGSFFSENIRKDSTIPWSKVV